MTLSLYFNTISLSLSLSLWIIFRIFSFSSYLFLCVENWNLNWFVYLVGVFICYIVCFNLRFDCFVLFCFVSFDTCDAFLVQALSYGYAYGMLSLLEILLKLSCLSSIVLECVEIIELLYSVLKCDLWCML